MLNGYKPEVAGMDLRVMSKNKDQFSVGNENSGCFVSIGAAFL